MALQTTYSTTMRPGLPGMVQNMIPYDADTRICETAAGIGFGLAVSQGAADDGAVLGGASAAVFVGVSMRDITLEGAQGDSYALGQNMGVMTKGDIWVTVSGAVTAGGDVTFNGTTGALGSAAVGAGQFAIAGARWMTGAADGGLAVLRLPASMPSA